MRLFRFDSKKTSKTDRDEKGIALFMVLSAMAVLSVLVTELTYTTQVNQRMAYDGADRLQAHYTAKTGFKISLLRLKAYQTVKGFIAKQGPVAEKMVPKQILEKIWSFPLFFPIPTSIPGLTMTQKDGIEKFQKNSGLAGQFSAQIESESSKFNLNSVLEAFSYPIPKPSGSPTPNSGGGSEEGTPPGSGPSPKPSGAASPTPAPSFSPEQAREALGNFLGQLLDNKIKDDQDFAAEHRDVHIEDLMDNILAWVDRTYERKNASVKELVPFKKAPFYSITELRQIPLIDDEIYEVIAPNLTINPTPGLNVNSAGPWSLRAIVPGMTDEEAKDFIKYRDSDEEDHTFKSVDEFYKLIQEKVAVFKSDSSEVQKLADHLAQKGVRLVTDESAFKITVQAQVGSAIKKLEAWVVLTPDSAASPTTAQPDPNNPNAPPPNNGSAALPPSDPTKNTNEQKPKATGLRVYFMRFL